MAADERRFKWYNFEFDDHITAKLQMIKELSARIGHTEKVEKVRVLENLTGHVGISRREGRRKVTDGFAVTLVSTALDLQRFSFE